MNIVIVLRRLGAVELSILLTRLLLLRSLARGKGSHAFEQSYVIECIVLY